MRKWEKLPNQLRTEAVRPYYEALRRKRGSLFAKRCFDLVVAFILVVLLSPVMLGLAIAIKTDSKGKVMFRQVRITRYGKEFRIFKFRTMVSDAERLGSQVTTNQDSRVTKVGRMLRKCRLDELPQLLNIIAGDMTFVGTRPEVPRYVEHYTEAMQATLLLPAGVTSETSILYKDEERLLSEAQNADETYVNEVLPAKMQYNLAYLENYSFWKDIRIMLHTVTAVLH
ncbi:MAG: sugar transferase [Clostridiales bacterium]|nr:sugar transferase [Clostridiales bacterium]